MIFVTVGSSEEADRIAARLVEERLAACVNRIRGVQSVYRWLGKLERSEEDLLIIKTKANLFDRLKERVQELHSYSVPEIISFRIEEGNEAYLGWLDEQVREK